MYDLPNTRNSLIVRLKTNSDDAWSEFLKVYEQAIFYFCQSRGLQDADARDVTQEVFSALYNRIDSWSESSSGSFRGWLFRVARNIAVDRIRQRARSADTADAQSLARVSTCVEQEDSAFRFEYRRSLFAWASDQTRKDVQEATWRCFWMTAVDDRNANEVAEEMNLSVGSVYTAKCRVMARIREKIAQLSENDDAFPSLERVTRAIRDRDRPSC